MKKEINLSEIMKKFRNENKLDDDKKWRRFCVIYSQKTSNASNPIQQIFAQTGVRISQEDFRRFLSDELGCAAGSKYAEQGIIP